MGLLFGLFLLLRFCSFYFIFVLMEDWLFGLLLSAEVGSMFFRLIFFIWSFHYLNFGPLNSWFFCLFCCFWWTNCIAFYLYYLIFILYLLFRLSCRTTWISLRFAILWFICYDLFQFWWLLFFRNSFLIIVNLTVLLFININFLLCRSSCLLLCLSSCLLLYLWRFYCLFLFNCRVLRLYWFFHCIYCLVFFRECILLSDWCL